MTRLIVHADDLGISDKVNEGILYAYKNGILTSASIMANGMAFRDAVKICKSNPTLDIGIHLTLVEEKPLLNPESIPDLVTEEGKFHQSAEQFIKKYLMRKISREQVFLELEAQIMKVFDQGIVISHIDSHQHLHMLPQILNIVVSIAEKYGIRIIRVPNEKPRWDMVIDSGFPFRLLQLLVLKWFCRKSNHLNFTKIKNFFGFSFSGIMNKANLLKILKRLPLTEISEIMCHPGFSDPKSPYTHWGYHWQDELDALIDPDIKEFIAYNKIELISFRKLAI